MDQMSGGNQELPNLYNLVVEECRIIQDYGPDLCNFGQASFST
jgi:hypothetical protein